MPELERAIHAYIERNNADPKPFVWTKSAHDNIGNVNRGRFPFNPGRNVNRMPGQNMNHMPVNRNPMNAARNTRLVSNSGGNRANSVVHPGAAARGESPDRR